MLSYQAIVRRLDKSGLPWAVFAGAAAAVYGAKRPINDLDILAQNTSGSHLAEIFPEAEVEYHPEGAIRGLCLPGCDILTATHIIELDHNMIARLQRYLIKGIDMSIIPVEDNIVFKAVLGRGPEQGKRDWLDVAEMLACQSSRLDWDYLSWRAKKCVSSKLLSVLLNQIEELIV